MTCAAFSFVFAWAGSQKYGNCWYTVVDDRYWRISWGRPSKGGVSGAPNEVWSYGEEVYEICKKYIRIREQLRPYTAQLMKEAHEKGTPVMRTLFYEFPEDKHCWEVETEYMYGSDLLVAPVMEAGKRVRTVYFPKGNYWKDCESDKIYTGGEYYEVEAPIDKIPVFRKIEIEQ